jgi:hypothetical protein
VAQLLEYAGPLSTVASYRFPSSQRRHYEKTRRLLPGFVTLGDAACSFNPIYGQGMACAAFQANALGETVREVGVGPDELLALFHRRSAKIIDAPWAIAVGADFLHPRTDGPKAKDTDQLARPAVGDGPGRGGLGVGTPPYRTGRASARRASLDRLPSAPLAVAANGFGIGRHGQ